VGLRKAQGRIVPTAKWLAEQREPSVLWEEDTHERRPGRRRPSADDKRRGAIAVAVTILVICGLFILAAGLQEEGPSGDRAYSLCKQWVKLRLKAPATASFDVLATSIRSNDAGTGILVEGPVDSENGFGANIRSHYTCVITRDPQTERYTVDSVIVL
jgi:hypothetical protein